MQDVDWLTDDLHGDKSQPRRQPIDPLVTGLPASHDSEKRVLDAVMAGTADFSSIGSLRASDFDVPSHKLIFSAMAGLHMRSEKIDYITVANELSRSGQLARAGGRAYLISLNDGMSRIAGIDTHVRLIAKKSALRQIAFVADAIKNNALVEADDPAVLISRAQDVLGSIGASDVRADVLTEVPSIWTFDSTTTYLVEELVLAGGITMWSGESGDGKSTLALAMAGAVAQGDPFLGRSVMQRPVVIFDRENPAATVKDRLYRLGIPDLGDRLIIWETWWEDHYPPGPDAKAVIIHARRLKPLIIWDSLVAFAGCEENSANEMRHHMTRYRHLAALGATVLIIHHRSEKSQSDYRGSSDIRAAVDSAWRLCRDDGSTAGEALGRLVLKPYKTRTGPAKPVRIEYRDGCFIPVDGPPRPPVVIVVELVTTRPGATQKELIALGAKHGLSQHPLVEALDAAVLKRLVIATRGRHNALRYYPPQPTLAASA